MPQVAVEIEMRVPRAVLHAFILALAEDSHLSQAYFKIRGMASPSRLVERSPTRLVIFEPTFDPALKAHGAGKTGWTIAYDLEALGEETTRVGVTIEYDRRTAVMGMGLIKPQAENEIISRLGALLAFERGYHTHPGAERDEAPRALPEGTRVDPLPAPRPEADPTQPAGRDLA